MPAARFAREWREYAEYFERVGCGEASVDEIAFENGEVFDRRSRNQRVPFAALVKMCHLERVSVGERGFYSTQGLDWDADKGCGARKRRRGNGSAAIVILSRRSDEAEGAVAEDGRRTPQLLSRKGRER